jgi:hypothetical protein
MIIKIKMLETKKAQFYILIALLLIVAAFSVTKQDVPIRKPADSFLLLHEGFVKEGVHVINNAVYNDANISSNFANFTNAYVDFAKSSDPSFELAYFLKYGDKLSVGNRFDSNLNITVGSTGLLVSPGTEHTVSIANTTMLLNGLDYNFDFTEEDIQLKAIFRKKDKLEIRIFVRN